MSESSPVTPIKKKARRSLLLSIFKIFTLGLLGPYTVNFMLKFFLVIEDLEKIFFLKNKNKI